MKKIILLVLTLALALFMLASCKNKACDSHVDSDNNGICDNCEAEMPDPEKPDPENPDDPKCAHKDDDKNFVCDDCGEELPNTGLILSEAVIHQLKTAKTMKLELNIKELNTVDAWYYEDGEEYNYTNYYDQLDNILFTFTLDSEGGICAKIELTNKYAYAEGEEYETEQNVAYLTNGTFYTYDDELDVYVAEVIEGVDIAAITEALEAFTNDITVDEEAKEQLLTAIGELAVKSFNIFENKGSISIDLKDEANALLDYLAALDLESDTVRGILGDALALIDESLTVEAIEAEVFRVLGLTVNEALDEVDAWLTENHETTVQGIYDSIIDNPTVAQIIKDAIKMQLPEDEVEDIDATVEQIFNTSFKFNIREALEAEELGDMVLFDLIISITGMPVDEAPTLTDVQQMVAAMLDMTLSEFEEAMEVGIFLEIKSMAESITVNALDARLDIKFKGIFNIDSIEGAVNIDLMTEHDSEIEGKLDVSTLTITMSFKLYGISEQPTTITVPTDKEIYFDIYNEYFYGDNADLYIQVYDDVAIVTIWLYGSPEISIKSSELSLDILKSTMVTVPGNSLVFYSGGAPIDHDTTTDLVIAIDMASEAFYIVSCPEYDANYTAYDAINQIGCGEGVDNSEKFDLAPNFGGYFTIISGNTCYIEFNDDHYISGIVFEYVIDTETGDMICTITGVLCDADNSLYNANMSSFYGGTYDPVDLEAYFGSDLTFTISLTEDGVVVNDGIPDVPEQYRAY